MDVRNERYASAVRPAGSSAASTWNQSERPRFTSGISAITGRRVAPSTAATSRRRALRTSNRSRPAMPTSRPIPAPASSRDGPDSTADRIGGALVGSGTRTEVHELASSRVRRPAVSGPLCETSRMSWLIASRRSSVAFRLDSAAIFANGLVIAERKKSWFCRFCELGVALAGELRELGVVLRLAVRVQEDQQLVGERVRDPGCDRRAVGLCRDREGAGRAVGLGGDVHVAQRHGAGTALLGAPSAWCRRGRGARPCAGARAAAPAPPCSGRRRWWRAGRSGPSRCRGSCGFPAGRR